MTLKENSRQNYLNKNNHDKEQQERIHSASLFLWLEYQSVIWEQHTGLPALRLPGLGTLRVQTPIRHNRVSARPDRIRSLQVLLLDSHHGFQLWGEDRHAWPTFLLLISSILFHLSVHWNPFTAHHWPEILREANVRLCYTKAYSITHIIQPVKGHAGLPEVMEGSVTGCKESYISLYLGKCLIIRGN